VKVPTGVVSGPVYVVEEKEKIVSLKRNLDSEQEEELWLKKIF